MKVVSLSKELDNIKQLPSPSVFLGSRAKYHFKKIGKLLISAGSLKRIHISSLEVLALNFEQWEWSIREIRKKNKNAPGSGYIQTYKTGAKNISVELIVKRDAEKAIMQCFKLFGLDPKSEKELGGLVDPAQGDLFEQLNKKLG